VTSALRGWRRGDLMLTGALLALLLLWDASSADLWFERRWGTPAGFPWRDHWFTGRVVHDGGRWLAGLGLVALVVNLWWPWTPKVPRARRWAWLAVTVAGMVLMPLLKKASLTSCPWDLAEFGGAAHWVSHWRWGVADGGAGHCFPSGHATSAVGFLGSWFVLRDAHPRLARWTLALVCALGVVYGWGQMARGAHYASHTLWSAWICWTLGLAVLGYRRS
jgi:membrane-associated PAP2 superfamily phosphatase